MERAETFHITRFGEIRRVDSRNLAISPKQQSIVSPLITPSHLNSQIANNNNNSSHFNNNNTLASNNLTVSQSSRASDTATTGAPHSSASSDPVIITETSLDPSRDFTREQKWIRMIKQWDVKYGAKDASATHLDKLKRRVRKGIPDSVRACAWMKLSGAANAMACNAGVYQQRLAQHCLLDDVIQRDINRTFPNLILFNDHLPLSGLSRINRSDGSILGKASLYNVLRAYANHDLLVSYCQGMGFLVGLFLTYLTEEESFWLLHQYMRDPRYSMFGLYTPGFELLHSYFYTFDALLKQQSSKLHKHLAQHSVTPPIYATQWFITLFAYNHPFALVTRIWDIFWSEGSSKVSLKFALYMMSCCEKRLLKSEMEGVISILKSVHEDLAIIQDIDGTVERAMAIDIKTKQLEKLSHEHEQEKMAQMQQNAKSAKGRNKS